MTSSSGVDVQDVSFIMKYSAKPFQLVGVYSEYAPSSARVRAYLKQAGASYREQSAGSNAIVGCEPSSIELTLDDQVPRSLFQFN